MKRYLSLIALCWVVSLCGCSSSGVWFATTRMDISEYRPRKIAVLPVAALQDVAVSDDIKAGLQQAVVNGLDAYSVGIRNVQVVPQSELDTRKVETRFPWTPERVAAAAAALSPKNDVDGGIAGAIGISVTAVAQREGEQPAAITVIFVFADKEHATEKRWAMAGTWSDRHFDEIVSNVKRELRSYFIDLKFQALFGRNAFVRETYDVNQPFVTVFGPQGIFGDSATTPRSQLQLQITGIHDAGIDNISIHNDEAGYSLPLYAKLDSGRSQGPIYYSSYVNVPLIFGQNTIHITANPSTGTPSQRLPIRIRRTTPPGVRLIGLGVSNYDDLDPAPGAGDATRAVEDSLSQLLRPARFPVASAWGIDKMANGAFALDKLAEVRRMAALDDQVFFYFAGRVVTVFGRGRQGKEPRVYFTLSDASSGSPGLGSLSVQDLGHLLLLRRSVGVLDLCTSEPVGDLTALLVQSLPQNAVARVSQCDASVGRLGKEIVDWSGHQKLQGLSFATLVPWIKSHVADSVVGTHPPVSVEGGQDLVASYAPAATPR